MVYKRIIPLILVKDGRCVKGIRFQDHKDVGHPVTVARVYNDQEADELIFLSIDGKPLDKILEAVSSELAIPLSAGGGIRYLEDARRLFESGADKVVVNRVLFLAPDVVQEINYHYGTQATIAHQEYFFSPDPIDVQVGEVMLTSVPHEGTRRGMDIRALQNARKLFPCQIIGSGGAKSLEDIRDALEHVDAVAIGSLFHFTDQSPIKLRHYLKNEGIAVR